LPASPSRLRLPGPPTTFPSPPDRRRDRLHDPPTAERAPWPPPRHRSGSRDMPNPHRPGAWIALLALAGLAAAAPRGARACSVCLAGDAVFEASGTSVGETGQWNLFVQGSGWVKESGTLPGEEATEEKNKSQRLDVYLGWTPIDRFT